MGMDPEKAIGIDLGTTYSCVAVWQNGKAEVIANDQGNRTTPSMVAFTSQERLLGEGAKNQVALNPKNTVFDVKRLIGRRFSEPTVQRDVELWPFKVVADDMGQPLVEVEFKGERKRFPPQQICSMILEKMKKIAEDYLHSSVRNAVITVPAYFNDAQRKATQDAASIAGLKAIRIINEPSAAAIAYGFRSDAFTSDAGKTILVFDLGGGTFDVSIVSLHNGVFQVKGVGGDMHLGGEDLDNNLLDFCVAQFKRRNKGADNDIKNNAKAMRRLRTECERAKRTLSSAVETVIDIDALHEGYDFKSRITKAKFDELNSHLFERCIQIVSSSIAEAGMAADQIDEIVLVGGSSRIPRVRELLEELFPGRSLCKQLNPDEAIAMGAAIQAANLNNEGVELILTDVTPLSLGVSINGGMMNVVVPRNTPVPARKERSYTTRYDGQTELVFPVYEGERALVQDNNLIGEFRLAGIPWGPAGSADIRVTFTIDEDGILTVSAREQNSGVNGEITIAKCSGRLSLLQIEKMLKDAQMFRKDDDEARRRLAARNSLETLINNMKGRLRQSGVKEQLGLQASEQIYEELQSAQLWLDETDHIPTAELEQMFQALRAICRPVSLHSKSGK